MPWERLIEQTPAFGALCLLVYLAGRYLQGITNSYMDAMRGFMIQVRELSVTCHASHKEVADITASAVRDCTTAITDLRESQHETSLIMAEVKTLLKSVNGKVGP